MTTTATKSVEALSRLATFAEARLASNTPALTIALSRQAGSRGAEIARAVGERLGWAVYDHELLDRIAQEKGLQRRLLDQLDERTVHWLQSAIASFANSGEALEITYVKTLLQLFATLGKAGHAIIVGRGAAYVLPAATTLRVRVLAPLAVRVANIRRSRGLSAAEAERWVLATDDARRRFVQSNFRTDTADVANYDLVVNSARLGTEAWAQIIAETAKACEAALKRSADRGE
jgi:cytidylate kinase